MATDMQFWWIEHHSSSFPTPGNGEICDSDATFPYKREQAETKKWFRRS